MSEYFTKPISNDHCTNKFAVGPTDEKFFIICDTDMEAHKLSLSLLMSKVQTPLESPISYINCFEDSGVPYFKLIESQSEEDTQINSCCMSGCSGCPTFEEKMKDR